MGEREKPSEKSKRPDGSKTNSSQPRLLPRHSTMHLLGPLLLLLGKNCGLGLGSGMSVEAGGGGGKLWSKE